jgi:conjugative relaxase-like TrwC/TraI family protein
VPRERGQSAAECYTARGNPPGVWAGRGAPLLGLAGERVSEQQMFYLFGLGMHPDAEKIAEEYISAHKDEVRRVRGIEVLVRHAYQSAALGRAFPSYEGLEAFETRVAQRLAVIARETRRAPTPAESKRVKLEEARRQRAAVAGFDVVFAPVKSAAILWALDERAEVRGAVRAAYEAARDAALDLLEQYAAYTRTGSKGQAQIETRGLIAAVFDHYDSRAGDPNLHSHMAISSKVLGVDGKWRALDARGLYRMMVAASEFYNTRFETELAARLGVSFVARPDTAGGREPVREIAGIPTWIIEHFSDRRTEIEARYAQLVREYRREHGHDPSAGACHKLARQANLDTREGKKAPRSLSEMRVDWTQSITEAFGRDAVARVMAAVPVQTAIPVPSAELDVAEVAARVVGNVAEMRSTWTVWNLRAEAERLARLEAGFTTGVEHDRFVNYIIERAIAPGLCVRVDAPALLDEPARLRRSDGASVFTEHAAARYTSPLILDAEARLLDAATSQAAPTPIAQPVARTLLDGFEEQYGALDPGQRALALAFATDPRLLTVGLGPAGAGKPPRCARSPGSPKPRGGR